METLKMVLMVIFALDCIALTVIVLLQEGKSAGLGTIGGMGDTFWSQNKSRSMEGGLVLGTRILGAIFIILSIVLNFKMFV